METIQVLLSDLRADIKSLNKKLDVMNSELQVIKTDNSSRCYKCKPMLDDRYVSKAEIKNILKLETGYLDERYIERKDFENMFKNEIEKHYDQKMGKALRGTELAKNILNILQILSPVAIVLFGYYFVSNYVYQ